MKREQLMKELRKIGKKAKYELTFVRSGPHDTWRIAGRNLSIPHHKEINEHTARGIIKDARAAIEKAQAEKKKEEEDE